MGSVGIVGEYEELKVFQFFKLNRANGVEVQVNMGAMWKFAHHRSSAKKAQKHQEMILKNESYAHCDLLQFKIV